MGSPKFFAYTFKSLSRKCLNIGKSHRKGLIFCFLLIFSQLSIRDQFVFQKSLKKIRQVVTNIEISCELLIPIGAQRERERDYPPSNEKPYPLSDLGKTRSLFKEFFFLNWKSLQNLNPLDLSS